MKHYHIWPRMLRNEWPTVRSILSWRRSRTWDIFFACWPVPGQDIHFCRARHNIKHNIMAFVWNLPSPWRSTSYSSRNQWDTGARSFVKWLWFHASLERCNQSRWPSRVYTSTVLMILQETLRFHPFVTMLYRISSKDNILPLSEPVYLSDGSAISAIPIPKGQVVLASIYTYNRYGLRAYHNPSAYSYWGRLPSV